jgi:Domain of unknown function (DUF4398)
MQRRQRNQIGLTSHAAEEKKKMTRFNIGTERYTTGQPHNETAPPQHRFIRPSSLHFLLPLCGALIFSGCAGNPPTEQMAVSTSAVDRATSAGGADYAPIELRAAQDKLASANSAMSDNDYTKARRLASEAQVDANLADVKARSAKAQKAVQDTKEGLRVLQGEINRKNQMQNDSQ